MENVAFDDSFCPGDYFIYLFAQVRLGPGVRGPGGAQPEEGGVRGGLLPHRLHVSLPQPHVRELHARLPPHHRDQGAERVSPGQRAQRVSSAPAHDEAQGRRHRGHVTRIHPGVHGRDIS